MTDVHARYATDAAAELERLRAELEDLRHNLAQRAFTAPDADFDTILTSLDARIRDASQRAGSIRAWLPALRRAIDCLDTTCRYHGDQLDPDRFGRMTRSEACCDTGIEPRRAREARAALEALAPLDQQEQQ